MDIIIGRIITLFSIILFSLFSYVKILNLKWPGVKKIIYGITFSVLMAFGIQFLREIMPHLRFVIMILAMGIFAGISTGTKLDIALVATIISCGINYGFYLAFFAISTIMIYIFRYPENLILATIFAFIMQAAFIALLFRIKRLKKGMLFLQKRWAGVIGLVIGGVILLAISLIYDASDEAMIGIIISVVLGAAGLIIWWRRGLTRMYRDRVKERDMREHEEVMAAKEEEIQKLQESNDFLAKLIHRDNKLLPAMYEAVRLSLEKDDAKAQAESKRIMQQIEELMEERTEAITKTQRENKILPTTKDDLLDGLLAHMLTKAVEKEIQFDVTVVGEILGHAEVMSALHMQTLYADLIENAIIATSHSEYKRILITIGIEAGFYELNVQDTGIPFQIETLLKLGAQKASTHLDEGGSGIGYMTIFELLHACKASIVITEYEAKQYGFTKSVLIRFDDKDRYIVQTCRADEILALKAETELYPVIRHHTETS